jgi:hypothetical protein
MTMLCLSNKKWLGRDITLDEALDVLLPESYNEEGRLESLEAELKRVKWVLRTILSTEQILFLIKCNGYPDAVLCNTPPKN